MSDEKENIVLPQTYETKVEYLAETDSVRVTQLDPLGDPSDEVTVPRSFAKMLASAILDSAGEQ